MNLRGFIYDLAAFLAADYENDETFSVLAVLISHMDIRQTIANAKALAAHVGDPPDFHERAEVILNNIDNKLRNERNRYIHDRWVLWGPVIHRIRPGTIVKREPASGEKRIHHGITKRFLALGEMEEFAVQIDKAATQIEQLGQELRDILNETRPLAKE